jgi:DNA-directed RNA polymerase I subunit RPA2
MAIQVFMNIAVTSDDLKPEATHQELHPTQILSVVASLTPFSDFNQSPRNMYQCQVLFLLSTRKDLAFT